MKYNYLFILIHGRPIGIGTLALFAICFALLQYYSITVTLQWKNNVMKSIKSNLKCIKMSIIYKLYSIHCKYILINKK